MMVSEKMRGLRRPTYPCQLVELMASIEEVRPFTMVIGASPEGRPLILNLVNGEITNILVTGCRATGKTTLLRAMLYSMAAWNKQHQFQALVIDYQPAACQADPCLSLLAPFNHLPHLIKPLATTFEQAIRLLDFLVAELQYRQTHDIGAPKILAIIDNLDSLLEAGGQPLTSRLLRLLQYGTEVGIHLVLALEHPSGPLTNRIMKCDLPVRFIGRLPDEKIARAAAGISGTGAEFLQRPGDFIALYGGQTVPIQTAAISDYDVYLEVHRLSRPAAVNLRPARHYPGQRPAWLTQR